MGTNFCVLGLIPAALLSCCVIQKIVCDRVLLPLSTVPPRRDNVHSRASNCGGTPFQNSVPGHQPNSHTLCRGDAWVSHSPENRDVVMLHDEEFNSKRETNSSVGTG